MSLFNDESRNDHTAQLMAMFSSPKLQCIITVDIQLGMGQDDWKSRIYSTTNKSDIPRIINSPKKPSLANVF